MTWCVWAQLPNNPGWSRIAAGLEQRDAERFVSAMAFPARAMPENEE